MPRYAKRPRRVRRAPRSSAMATGTRRYKFKTSAGLGRSRTLLSGAYSHKHSVQMLNETDSYPIRLESRTDGVALWNVNGVSGTSLSASFSLNGVTMYINGVQQGEIPMPGRQTYKDMYDTYRIDRVEIELYVGADVTLDTTSNATVVSRFQPIILYAEDSEDAVNTPMNELLQYGNTQVVQPLPGKPCKFAIRPCAAMIASQVSAGIVAATGYSRKFSPELNITSADVQHYGFKMCSNMGQTGTVGSTVSRMPVTFKFKYFMTMMDTR